MERKRVVIEAFHSNWTRPFFNLNKRDNKFFIEDFEILTTILSALKWREKNGSIKMITDSIAAQYYSSLKIDSIWDLGMDVSLDNIVPKEINPKIFWAAGKLFALKKSKAPCIMIDTDFIVWKPIYNLIKVNKICTIHKENIDEKVYPPKEYFHMKKEYNFDKQWDWSVLPSNTALLFMGDENFKNYYVNSSINFMMNLKEAQDNITGMVFAEQRLISMCAKKKNINISEIMTLEKLFGGQDYFTHVWGFKNVMRNNFKLREAFCVKCIKRIIHDYPEYEGIIANIKQLSYYYQEAKNM